VTAIDTAVRELIDTAFQKASLILTANRALLNEAAGNLLAKETMCGDEPQAVARRLTSEHNAVRDVATATVEVSI
jgi:cell division protease FtsH